jgi:hypothetical protein
METRIKPFKLVLGVLYRFLLQRGYAGVNYIAMLKLDTLLDISDSLLSKPETRIEFFIPNCLQNSLLKIQLIKAPKHLKCLSQPSLAYHLTNALIDPLL